MALSRRGGVCQTFIVSGDGAAPESYEIASATLGLLTATHADSRMAGPVTMGYLAAVATDRSQMLSLLAGMTALATLLMQMRAGETGVAPDETLAELGRRVQELFVEGS